MTTRHVRTKAFRNSLRHAGSSLILFVLPLGCSTPRIAAPYTLSLSFPVGPAPSFTDSTDSLVRMGRANVASHATACKFAFLSENELLAKPGETQPVQLDAECDSLVALPPFARLKLAGAQHLLPSGQREWVPDLPDVGWPRELCEHRQDLVARSTDSPPSSVTYSMAFYLVPAADDDVDPIEIVFESTDFVGPNPRVDVKVVSTRRVKWDQVRLTEVPSRPPVRYAQRNP